MSNKIHGVIRTHNTPGRVMNVRSRKNLINHKIRLDKIITSPRPSIKVIRRLGGAGDVIMSLPLLKHIKRLIPHAELTYETDLQYMEGALGEIILHNPYVDNLISNGSSNNNYYDYVVDITTTGLNREKSGFVPPNRIDMFAEEVGVDVSSDPTPDYIVTEQEKVDAQEFILSDLKITNRDDHNIIMVQCRSNDARRTWPLEYVDQLADLLVQDNSKNIVLLMDWGHTTDRWQDRENIFAIKDLSFVETAALMEQCDLVVCPDSSLLHLAGALNKKTITIFGPIPPESRINYYPNATAVFVKLRCSHCVEGNSKVLTDTIYKKIKDIIPGDKVLTNSGEFNNVTEIHKNNLDNRKLFEINTFGNNKNIVVTEDHKILTVNKYLSYKKADWFPGTRRGVMKFTIPIWTEAKNLTDKHYCCIPIPKTQIPVNKLLLKEDLAWLVGLFMAEGWLNTPIKTRREYSVEFAISSKEIEISKKVKRIVKENPDVFNSLHGKKFFSTHKNSKGNSTVLHISNKNFVILLLDLFKLKNKINLSNKYIPNELILAPKNIIKSFLDGFCTGDGYISNQRNLEKVYTTAKEDIAFGIQLLYTKLGTFPKIYKRIRDTNFKKDTTIYRVYVSEEPQFKRWWKTDTHFYVPIRSIKEVHISEDFVYDITVDKDTTFTINNLSVFDCWYSPSCVDNNKLECLKLVKPEMVLEEINKKMDEDIKLLQSVVYGKDISKGGQDNLIYICRRVGGLGDILMCGPALKALKIKYPDKKIHFAIPKQYIDLMKNLDFIDKILDVEAPVNYNVYYMIMDISSPCAKYEHARISMNKKVEKSRVEIFAEALGVRHLLDSHIPYYIVTSEEKELAQKILDESKLINNNKKTIAICPRSAEVYRDYEYKNASQLITLLMEEYNVILIGNNNNIVIPEVLEVSGYPIRQWSAILSLCDGFISVDTGPLHIAAALQIPTIGLFGPIDYKVRCKGYKNTTIIKSNLPCIPCWRNAIMKCKQNNLIKAPSKCMDIPPSTIFNITKRKLK